MNIMLPQKFKVQNGRHFWKEKGKFYFNWAGLPYLEKLSYILLRFPGGRKFRRNRSISNG